jgi:general secretion pathway protein D
MAPNFNVVLDALSAVTDVEVLSTPRIMVMSNDTATLQVGNSVPIITQSSSGTQDNSLIINSVIYRDTGVVLTVTPRVGDRNQMSIDIQQEVSDVSPTTTSTIDSPTIQQRKFHTRIEVENGQSVAIGGLIQTTRSKGDNGVPYLSRIPGIGAAFRQRQTTTARTELVVFLKPTLVRSRTEADAVTDELAAGLKALGYGRGAR